ncbi:acyltransferase [Candidatus Nitrosacidococcus tergens]|uniref:Transferase hexapeptide repeat containing protein n=1 Tax=Candidatus Nitrosacidococcus tergens TaxID=553981 RepID=A0A7G1Q7Y0_9GAMM|nr:acyltransferase [Candidatus Nitrosacidococcus tergens]CAB1274345.1 Transferase hexapeptide repeat containing protein [Candidatus Nitrosacidococcus tergens]
MADRLGFPRVVDSFLGIDKLGKDCQISPTVTVMRIGVSKSDQQIVLGNQVILFDYIRLVLGDTVLLPSAQLIIQDKTIINVGCYLSGEGGLIIEEEVLIGPHVRILSAGHEIHQGSPVVSHNEITHAPIRIGHGAWVGAGATILQGVDLGIGCVVGASSVVTRSIPPYGVAIGNPAKVKHYRRGHKPKQYWWFWRNFI